MNYPLLDRILWVFPLLISFLLSLLSLRQFTLKKTLQHKYLFHLFNILVFTFLFNYLMYKELWMILSYVYVITMPVNLLLFPVFYFYLYTVIHGVDIASKRKLPHFLPSLIVFLLMLPFVIISKESRSEFLRMQLSDDFSNIIIEYIEVIRDVVLFVVFNLQFAFYFVLILKTLASKKVRKTQMYTKTVIAERILLSMMFFTLLMVLINYSYHLGVHSVLSSSIFFNFVSSLLMVFLFIWGFYQKVLTRRKT